LLPLIAGLVVAIVIRQNKLPFRRLLFTAGVAIVGLCAVLGVRTLAWVWSQIN
jgi:hypothetical protein